MNFIKHAVPGLHTRCSKRTEVNNWGQPPSVIVPNPLKIYAPANKSLLHSGSSVRVGEEGEHSQLRVLLRNFSTSFFLLDLNARSKDEKETIYSSSEHLPLKWESRFLDFYLFERPQMPIFLFLDKYYVR